MTQSAIRFSAHHLTDQFPVARSPSHSTIQPTEHRITKPITQSPNHTQQPSIELNRHTTRMEIRGSVVSLSFTFPHPPEDIKKKKKIQSPGIPRTQGTRNRPATSKVCNHGRIQPPSSQSKQPNTRLHFTRPPTNHLIRQKKQSPGNTHSTIPNVFTQRLPNNQ